MDFEASDYNRGRAGRPFTRLKLWLKANGTNICWLCGQRIDMTLPPNARMAWTLDHCIPLSKAPQLALDKGNAREAHRMCNSVRQDRDPSTVHKPRTSRQW